MTLLVGGFVTTNESWSLFVLGQDAKLPAVDRLFLDWRVSLSSFTEFDSYIDGNPAFEVDWIMLAPFIEVGRVADHWSVSDLHRDMDVSGGIGIRGMAKHVVLRVDTAFSDEGSRVQMMVHHPF